ncbi:hypothetical protein [Roseitranquillus sediminis]|uniref:hypothetical protein n=1 Tax=Roseitranquillus sediminis TaxID=2809051 RepID=UPI001D0C4537|nr:hypothetical protein [Roseitranquillus sediminis]MBM9594848.1 hypothetical protein [Roseitranquillus sediminis]
MRWLALACLAASAAAADPARTVDVEAAQHGGGWRFDVALRHDDTGWDDYADGWRVELPDGTVLGTRELLHPHVDEQPFTRALTDISIPPDARLVVIRARTSVEGWGDDVSRVSLQ